MVCENDIFEIPEKYWIKMKKYVDIGNVRMYTI